MEFQDNMLARLADEDYCASEITGKKELQLAFAIGTSSRLDKAIINHKS